MSEKKLLLFRDSINIAKMKSNCGHFVGKASILAVKENGWVQLPIVVKAIALICIHCVPSVIGAIHICTQIYLNHAFLWNCSWFIFEEFLSFWYLRWKRNLQTCYECRLMSTDGWIDRSSNTAASDEWFGLRMESTIENGRKAVCF